MNTFNIIGIDPGNNTGISILNIDANTLKLLHIHTLFFKLENYSSNIIEDNLLSKLVYIKEIVHYLSNTYNPIVVGIESAFMNTRFPKAIINLSQYVGTLELEFKLCNNFTKVLKYAPKYIKSIISTGDADKKDMSKGISKIKEIKNLVPNIKELTEHEIDAIAIGYVTLEEIRKYPLYLIKI